MVLGQVLKNGKTAFVSGATGATGRSVVAQLAHKGYIVFALTRKSGDKLKLFPELGEDFFDNVFIICHEDTEQWSRQSPLFPIPELLKIDIVFLCHGVSREHKEVSEAIDDSGDEGFAEWLQRIDVGKTIRIARGAVQAKVPVIVRMSATNADANNDKGGFNVYFRHHGVCDSRLYSLLQRRGGCESRLLVFRPGVLDRGEELRALRPWEQRVMADLRTRKRTTDVKKLAKVMIEEAEFSAKCMEQGRTKIYEIPEITNLIQGHKPIFRG